MSLRNHLVSNTWRTVEIRGDKWEIRRLTFGESDRLQSIPSPLKWGETLALGLKDAGMTGQEIIDSIDAGLVDLLAAAIWRHTNGDDDSPK